MIICEPRPEPRDAVERAKRAIEGRTMTDLQTERGVLDLLRLVTVLDNEVERLRAVERPPSGLEIASFFVDGNPRPKGSKKGIVVKGRSVLIEASKGEKPWAQRVHWAAKEHAPAQMWDCPVGVDLDFRFPRPKYLEEPPGKRSPGTCHLTEVPFTSTPDVDKAMRSIFDALKGVIYDDDRRVTEAFARKTYADHGQPPGVHIVVERLEAKP